MVLPLIQMEKTSRSTGKNSIASHGGIDAPQTILTRARFSKLRSQNTEETAGANQLHFCRTLLLRKSQITNCFKFGIPLYTIAYHCMPLHSLVAYHRTPSHTIVHHRIPLYTIAYHCTPSYTIVHHRIPYPSDGK
jgi:hypothetical protein